MDLQEQHKGSIKDLLSEENDDYVAKDQTKLASHEFWNKILSLNRRLQL